MSFPVVWEQQTIQNPTSKPLKRIHTHAVHNTQPDHQGCTNMQWKQQECSEMVKTKSGDSKHWKWSTKHWKWSTWSIWCCLASCMYVKGGHGTLSSASSSNCSACLRYVNVFINWGLDGLQKKNGNDTKILSIAVVCLSRAHCYAIVNKNYIMS